MIDLYRIFKINANFTFPTTFEHFLNKPIELYIRDIVLT